VSSIRIAVAAPNDLATAAATRAAAEGGNAVDAALAAALVTMVSEPGLVSLASGGFLTIQPADGSAPVTIDGWVRVPGVGLPPERLGRGVWDIHTPYGGGTTMTIGHGSVAVPGTLRALDLAHRRYGQAPWRDVVGQAVEGARGGFPIGQATHHYLEYVHELVFGWHPDSHAVLHDGSGALVPSGSTIHVPHLADSLELIATEGVDAFYTGDLARLITTDMADHDGALTMADLAAYKAVARPSLDLERAGWRLATNPGPARGGFAAAAILDRLGELPASGSWSDDELRRLVQVQHEVLGADPAALTSPSTAHVSVVDDAGTACAITVSSGYSSGVLAPGTGIWLNNCLGEQELLPDGFGQLRPGEAMTSNMAPTVGRRPSDGAVLAIGSPGSDRIPTAIAQVLALHVNGGLALAEAVAHPRVHVRVREALDPPVRVDHEDDLRLPADLGLPTLAMPPHSMYFGGVGVARWSPVSGLSAAGDPRRTGAVAVTGGSSAAGA
jgi:gamma-glutamyltranspeptidase/glutathione hydrolase